MTLTHIPSLPRLSLAIFLVASTTAVAAQDLLCSTEFAAGIAFDHGANRWHAGAFRPDAKYVVARTENQNAKLEVRELGKTTPAAFCKEEFSDDGWLYCVGIFQEFHFNRRMMRFLHVYKAGYWNEDSMNRVTPGRKEGNDTPGVSAGTCAAF